MKEKLAEAFKQGFQDVYQDHMTKEAIDPVTIGGGLGALAGAGIGAKGHQDLSKVVERAKEWDSSVQEAVDKANRAAVGESASGFKDMAIDAGKPGSDRFYKMQKLKNFLDQAGGIEGSNVDEVLKTYADKGGDVAQTKLLGVPVGRFSQGWAKLNDMAGAFKGYTFDPVEHQRVFVEEDVDRRAQQLMNEQISRTDKGGGLGISDLPEDLQKTIKDSSVSVSEVAKKLEQSDFNNFARRYKTLASVYPRFIQGLPKKYGTIAANKWLPKSFAGATTVGGAAAGAGLGSLSKRFMGSEPSRSEKLLKSISNVTPRAAGIGSLAGAGALGLSEASGITDIF